MNDTPRGLDPHRSGSISDALTEKLLTSEADSGSIEKVEPQPKIIKRRKRQNSATCPECKGSMRMAYITKDVGGFARMDGYYGCPRCRKMFGATYAEVKDHGEGDVKHLPDGVEIATG